MEKLKQFWNKFRVWIGLFLTGVAISFLVLRKHVGEGIEEHKQQLKKEEEVKAEAQRKLLEETAKLQSQKQEELQEVKTEQVQKLKDAVVKAKEEKRKLVEQAKKDPQGFKMELQKELGVKEKKKKGRQK